MRQSWQRTRRQQRKRKRNFTLRLAAIVPGQGRAGQAKDEGYRLLRSDPRAVAMPFM